MKVYKRKKREREILNGKIILLLILSVVIIGQYAINTNTHLSLIPDFFENNKTDDSKFLENTHNPKFNGNYKKYQEYDDIHFLWQVRLFSSGQVGSDLSLYFNHSGTYDVNVSIPITAHSIVLRNYQGVNYSWIPVEATYRILHIHTTLNISGTVLSLNYQWNACSTFYHERWYVGGNENWIPTPQVLIENNTEFCKGDIRFDVPAKDLNSFEFYVNEPTEILSRYGNYQLLFEHPIYFPQFSYQPRSPPSDASFTTIFSPHFQLTLPKSLHSFSHNVSEFLERAYKDLFDYIGLLPTFNSIPIKVYPSQLFSELSPLPSAAGVYLCIASEILIHSRYLILSAQGNVWAQQIIVHEMTHAFTHHLSIGGTADVIVEGLAEYISWNIIHEWGFIEEYSQHQRFVNNQLDRFLSSNNNSLTPIWQWNLELSELTRGYSVACWIVESISNATPRGTWSRFIRNAAVLGWPWLGRVGYLIPIMSGGCWGALSAHLTIAAGVPTDLLLISLGCPLISYSISAYFLIVVLTSIILFVELHQHPGEIPFIKTGSRTRAWTLLAIGLFLLSILSWIPVVIILIVSYLLSKIFPRLIDSGGWPPQLPQQNENEINSEF